MNYIPTKEMTTNGLTKPLPQPDFERFVNLLHLTPLTS